MRRPSGSTGRTSATSTIAACTSIRALPMRLATARSRPSRPARCRNSRRAGKGRDVLYLPGAGGHMPNDPLLAALAKKYRVSAPLLPGYGQSSGEEGLRDMLDVTLHALDVMEKLRLKKPIVVGHSMGGM